MKEQKKATIRKPAPLPEVSADEALHYAEAKAEPTVATVFTVEASPPLEPAPVAATSTQDVARLKRIGRVPTGDVRLSINVSVDLHTRLKLQAVRQRTTVGQIIERWIRENTPEA